MERLGPAHAVTYTDNVDLLEEISALLRQHGVRLNRDLGQHFLVRRDVLDVIVAAADLQPTDTVVEIGPGIGVLTRELLDRAGSVQAIELDTRLIPLLKHFCGPERRKKLTVIEGNALRVPLPQTPYKIVANIPYHITSPLIRHAYIESTQRPKSMTLLIQREVAEKICDPQHAGILTIIVGLFGTPSIQCHVPPGCFLPPPAVDSSVLHIESFAEPLADAQTIERIFWLTKMGFSQKRKMLRNTLGHAPGGHEALTALGIDMERRPETLTVAEWIALARQWPAGSSQA